METYISRVMTFNSANTSFLMDLDLKAQENVRKDAHFVNSLLNLLMYLLLCFLVY